MNHPFGVSESDRSGDILHHPNALLSRRIFVREILGEIGPLHVVHRDEMGRLPRRIADDAHLVHADDIRMT